MVTLADETASGPGEAASLAEIARRHDDVRAALDWADAAQNGELALRLAAAAGWFWYVRGHLAEGRARLETALSRVTAGDSELRAIACMRAGSIADAQVDIPAAERFYREALEIRLRLGDRAGTFGPLNNLGNLALQSGDYAAARRAHEEGLALARELDEADPIASSLHNLALVHLVEDDAAGALPLLEESLVLAEALETPYGLANVHANLGAALVDLGELGRAAGAPRGERPAAPRARCDRVAAADDRGSGRPRARDRRRRGRGEAAWCRDGRPRQRRRRNRAQRRRPGRPHGGEGASRSSATTRSSGVRARAAGSRSPRRSSSPSARGRRRGRDTWLGSDA